MAASILSRLCIVSKVLIPRISLSTTVIIDCKFVAFLRYKPEIYKVFSNLSLKKHLTSEVFSSMLKCNVKIVTYQKEKLILHFEYAKAYK